MSKQARNMLAVVMARGGSVGLPGKSLRLLLGRPVLAYTLDHVRESKRITRSVVSSDSAEILAVARGEGFEVIERPGELATSTSATDPVLRHAVRVLYPRAGGGDGTTEARRHGGRTEISDLRLEISEGVPEAVVMLYGNVPVREGGMIDRCVEMLFETGCDSVQTVASVGKYHPYWMFDREGDGRIRKHVKNDVFRRQELPALYSPTGAVYVVRTSVLMASEGSGDPHSFLGEDRRGLVVGAEESVDIDTERDLFLAEAMLKTRKS